MDLEHAPLAARTQRPRKAARSSSRLIAAKILLASPLSLPGRILEASACEH